MTRSNNDYLQDILAATKHAISFVDSISFDEFMDNVEKQFAVIRALEIIGEAANNIPKDVQEHYPKVPWSEMIGMRNVMIHAYFGVDEQVIWRTVQEDLPSLRDSLQTILGT